MKKILNSIIVVFILSIFIFEQVKAQDAIEIDYFYGFTGSVLSSKGFPLQITVKNSGNDFSGDLVIKVPVQQDIVTNIKVDIDVLAHSQATYTVYLPGMDTQTMKPIVTLYKGHFQDGKEIEYTGSKTLTPKYYSAGSTIIGTLTSTIERTKFLESIKEVTNQIVLTKENFPKSSLGLEMFQFIFVDDIPLDTLSNEQLESLQEWIHRGGTLISSSLPNQTLDFLPFTIKNTIQINTNLQWNNDSFTEPMRAFDVMFDDHTEIITNDQGLVIGKKAIGNGAVIHLNYVMGDNPLISWGSYPNWLYFNLDKADVLQENKGLTTQAIVSNIPLLNSVTEYFKATSVSLGVMAILLIGYLLIVTAVVYVVLKKKNKLEIAWLVIPVIAILSSIVIFIVGAKDRFFESKLNQVAVYTNHNGYLNGVVVSNLLTNKGGDVALTLNEQVPIYTVNSRTFINNLNFHKGIVEMGSNQATISFEDTNYWSTISAASLVETQNVGSFHTNLQVKDGKLQGTITNNYSFDYTDLAIWSGNDLYELPSIKANETIEVDVALTTSLLSRPGYLNLNFNYSQYKEMKQMKLEATHNYILNLISSIDSETFSKPALLAQTNEKLHSFSLEKGKYSVDSLSYIYEPIDVTFNTEGEIIIQSERLNHTEAIISGVISNSEKDSQWYYIEPGEYEFTYDLPVELKTKNVKLKEVETYFPSLDSSIEFLLYDYKNSEYVLLDQQKLIAISENDFIQDNQFKLKLIKTSNEFGGDIILPEMTMKWEVSK